MFDLLFIEDNEFDRTFYHHFASEFVNLKNYKMAVSVKEAAILLKCNKFDVIVTDFDLGDGDAFDILEFSENTPVIVVTGKGNEQVASDAYRRGVYDYLIKDKSYNYLRKLQISIENAIEFKRVKRQLYKSEKKYQLLVEYANEIIYMTDRKGNITFINQHGRSILGYELNEVLGNHFTTFIDQEYVTTAQEFYKDSFINRVENTYLELPFISKKGDTIWVGQKVTSLYENKNNSPKDLIGYTAFGRDITEKIEAGKQIKYQNLQLEQKNKEVSDMLETLVKVKASKTANAIILIIALILFVFSEGLLEPIVDDITKNQYSGFVIKGFIALSLKPLDVFVERITMKRSFNKLSKVKDIGSSFPMTRKSWILRFTNLD